MEQSETINELAKALCEAQKETLFALKDSSNPFFKSKYADLSSVWDAARQPLTKNGLAVVQTMRPGDDGKVVIVTTLMHTSGQWMKSFLPVRPVKDDPQSVGSAITYGRRYGLQAIVGICPEDDDGEKSMGRNKPSAKPEPPQNMRTESQVAEIFKAGESIGIDKASVIALLKWKYRGKPLTVDDADFVINNISVFWAEYQDEKSKVVTK